MIDEILRVGSDDILYRLRAEEAERAEEISMWRRNACGGSIQEADHYHSLASDAAFEIVRLRLKLREAGISFASSISSMVISSARSAAATERASALRSASSLRRFR
jgi:hypothetical protein